MQYATIKDFYIGIPYEISALSFHLDVKLADKTILTVCIHDYNVFWKFWRYLKFYDFDYKNKLLILDDDYKFIGIPDQEEYSKWLGGQKEYDCIVFEKVLNN